MKRRLLTRWVVASGVLAAALVRGGTPPASDESIPVVPLTPGTVEESIPIVPLTPRAPERRNKIRVSQRIGLNVTADFRKLGGLAAQSNPNLHTDPQNTNTVIRTYDSGGYVGTDITGNNHGPGFENTTWYWGYGSDASAQGGSLVLSSSSSPANAVTENNGDDPQLGFEISYARELYRDPDNRWRAGFEGAFGFSQLSISESRTLTATVTRITDTFSVPGGVVVPPPGYEGTYEGPGSLIGSDPTGRTTTRTVQRGVDTIVGNRSLDANIFGFRLGPYGEIPLYDRFSLFVGGGLYMVIGDTHFRFVETVTIVDPDTGAQLSESRRGGGSQLDFLVGGYAVANIEYALTDDVGAFVGAQFQTAGQSVNRKKGKEAILDLGEGIVVSIGASYSF